MTCSMPNTGFDYRESIGPATAGLTVLQHLVARHGHSDETAWRERVEAGLVLVEGCVATCRQPLRIGQSLVWRRPPWVEPRAPLSWALLYRDADLLGVLKPVGLPTMPGGGFLQNTLLMLVRRHHPTASALHRLDRGASGLVLFATSARARDRLAEAFRQGRITKEYRALVDGRPAADAFSITTPIVRLRHPHRGLIHAAGPMADCVIDKERPARTEVRVLERGQDRSLVQVLPETGRAHQIRIHLAAAGHPLSGDPFYGPGGLPRPDAGRPGDTGYHLYATRLAFLHPGDGRAIALEAPVPRALTGTNGAAL